MGFKFPKKLPKGWIAQLEKTNPSKSPAPVIRLNNGGGDPNFGYESVGSNKNKIDNEIRGSWFTCPEAGTADSITVYLSCLFGGSWKHKCAIYLKSDYSLVGVTEERIIATAPGGWETFNFSDPKPSLSATDYVLVAWAETGAYTTMHQNVVSSKGRKQSIDYNGFPDPLVPGTNNMQFSIFCTYTVPGVIPTVTTQDATDIGVD